MAEGHAHVGRRCCTRRTASSSSTRTAIPRQDRPVRDPRDREADHEPPAREQPGQEAHPDAVEPGERVPVLPPAGHAQDLQEDGEAPPLRKSARVHHHAHQPRARATRCARFFGAFATVGAQLDADAKSCASRRRRRTSSSRTCPRSPCERRTPSRRRTSPTCRRSSTRRLRFGGPPRSTQR